MEFNQCHFLNSEKMEVVLLLTTNKATHNRSLPKNYKNQNQVKK